MAVKCIVDAPLDQYEAPTWGDLVEDPVELLAYATDDGDLPPDVYTAGGSFLWPGRRTTQRNPMWLVEVSIASGWRAAGRYRRQ